MDGPEAAKRVFRTGLEARLLHPPTRPQWVGFAIRDGIPYRCNGDLNCLDIDAHALGPTSPCPGTTANPPARRASKSGCFDGRMTRRRAPRKLQEQAPSWKRWIDTRVREGVDFAVLGDFNRHLERDARYPAGPMKPPR